MNPEAIEAAAKAVFEVRDDPYDLDDWEDIDSTDRELFTCQARAALEAAAPHLIRDEALEQMRSMPWFEDMVMAEAVAFHSGGNCRYVREARAAELEAAAFEFMGDFITGDYNSTPQQVGDWLRARAAAIRDGEA